MSRFRIGVDLGNSRIKCWLLTGLQDRSFQAAIAAPQWLEDLSTWRERLRPVPLSHDDAAELPCEWLVASVQHTAGSRFAAHIQCQFPADRIRFLSAADVPLASSVVSRSALGIDRLLTSWAAWQLCGHATIVADAGSALTVDWTDSAGTFRGGAICPGMQMQLQSLAERTSALGAAVQTLLEADPLRGLAALEYPGQDTAAAIAVGVSTSIVAAIESFAGHIQCTTSGPVTLLLTGGDSGRISPLLKLQHRLAPDLLRDAIAMLHQQL